MTKAILIFLLTALAHIATATVRIYGNAPEYAGYNLELYRYADYITHNRELVTVLSIDSIGRFDREIELDQTTYAFLELGTYMAYIYLEPNMEYEIALPPFSPRPDADRFNPYYQPELVELGIRNQTSCLNESIRNFDYYFNSHYHPAAPSLVRLRNVRLADRIIANCDSIARLQNCDNDYFQQYVRFKNAQTYATPRLRSVRNVLNRRFASEETAYNQPAYWEAFGLIGQNFIASYVATRSGLELKTALTKRPLSFNDLSEALKKDTVFENDALRETLVLKGIYDGYYTNYLADGLTDSLLISATHQAVREETKMIALNILNKKNKLRVGTKAPDFVLLDMQGREHKLSDLQGKFVYLAFLHTDNYACVKDFPALSSLQRKYRNDLIVVGIMTNEETDKLDGYFKTKKVEWTILSYNYMQTVVLNYGIQTLPSYFIIDPDGKIARSPAPAPTEDIQKAIAECMLDYKRASLKRNPQEMKDIYKLAEEQDKDPNKRTRW